MGRTFETSRGFRLRRDKRRINAVIVEGPKKVGVTLGVHDPVGQKTLLIVLSRQEAVKLGSALLAFAGYDGKAVAIPALPARLQIGKPKSRRASRGA